ncbi:MAG: flagellar export protein FliJ [Burkholderiaceae bacterium]|jgi:flagellar FliJ protein
MPSSDQLQLLAELADERCEASLRQLAAARQTLAAARDQLNQLNQYGSDYHSRLGQEAAGGIDSDMLRNYQGFISNVAQAIVQQTAEVARREDACKAAEAAWRDAQRQLDSFKALAQREAARKRQVADRRQQKIDDEFTARMGLFGLRTAI